VRLDVDDTAFRAGADPLVAWAKRSAEIVPVTTVPFQHTIYVSRWSPRKVTACVAGRHGDTTAASSDCRWGATSRCATAQRLGAGACR